MTNADLHDALDEGQSVAQIAETHGLTQSAVYLRMRQLGRSAHKVAAERSQASGRTFSACPSYEGYRVCMEDGTVQSCWTRGQNPVMVPRQWRDLGIQCLRRGKWISLYVTLGSCAGGTRTRPSLRTLYRDAFGSLREHRADALYDRVRARYQDAEHRSE